MASFVARRSISRTSARHRIPVAAVAALIILGTLGSLPVMAVDGATVTIVKATNPSSDPQDFDFDLTGAGFASDVDLDTDAGSGTPSQETFALSALQLGAHTITESSVPGWDLTQLACTGDADFVQTGATASLDVDAGETILCTFTNTKHASLTVAKVTDPASDPQDFDFDLTGAGLPSDVDLDTDPGSASVPSQQSFNLNAAQLGAHTVTESASIGWSLTDLACTGAGDDSETDTTSRRATLDIDPGETVVCTFTNTMLGGASVTIVKVTDPASDPQDFDFDLTGAGLPSDLDIDTDPGSGSLPSQQTFSLSALQLGAHTISESAAPGWSLTDLQCTGDADFVRTGATATLDVDADETIVCTFTNTKHASLTVVKVTDPAGHPQDFDFDLTGAGLPADLDLDTDLASAGLPSQQSFNLNAAQLGAHTVTESAAAGWTLTNLQCTGAGDDSETDTTSRTATLDIDPGESVVCTFTNTGLGASLTIVKATQPASDPQDFDFDLTGEGLPADADLDTDAGSAGTPSQETYALNALQLGAHTVTESTLPGWTLTDLQCTGDADFVRTGNAAALDIDAGETVVCTFANTKHASLTVVKVTDPASHPQDFDFDLTGAGLPSDVDLDTDPTSADLPTQQSFSLNAAQLGGHTVSESATPGWSLSALACTGDADFVRAGNTSTLDIDPGENVVCTFTNTRTFHVGTIGFWRNWRNHYSSSELATLTAYVRTNNPAVYGQAGNLLDASRLDAIYQFSRSKSAAQPLLAQLTALKLNLAATNLGLNEADDICTGGTVYVAAIPGATALFGSSTPTVSSVVAWVESRWTGTLTTNPRDWSFAMSKAQLATVQAVVEAINSGAGVVTTGCV